MNTVETFCKFKLSIFASEELVLEDRNAITSHFEKDESKIFLLKLPEFTD